MILSNRLIPLCGLILAALLFLNVSPHVQGLLQASVPISFSGTISNSSTGVPWLHASGQNIYDSSESQVKLYACVIQDGDGNHIAQGDIQKIKNMGFNAIRLFFMWRLVQPNGPTSINTAYFTQASGASPTTGAGVDYVVDWASQLGMYVILCPGWSTTWQPPSWAASLSSGTGVTSGGSTTKIDMFYNSQVQAGIYYMYNWMAQHYATNSNVLFESFNEIATTRDSDAPAFAAYNDGWISAIESGEDANSHLKIVQLLYNWGNSWNYVLTVPFVSGTHTNILLATHSYPFVNSAQIVASQCAQIWSTAIHSQNLPWIDTEFGTAVGGGYGTPGLTYAVSLFNTYNAVGWGFFCYDSNPLTESTWNINNPTNEASILPILQSGMIQP